MQPLKHSRTKLGFTAALLSLGLAAFIYWFSLPFVMARDADTTEKAAPDSAGTNAPAPAATDTNAPVFGPPDPNAHAKVTVGTTFPAPTLKAPTLPPPRRRKNRLTT